MQFVCNDLDGKSPWHYDPKIKTYFRCHEKEEVATMKDEKIAITVREKHQGMIHGDHLPDPDVLWALRNEVVRKALGSLPPEARERNKPSATTFKLWQHWQGAVK